jgi:hypothetical protein
MKHIPFNLMKIQVEITSKTNKSIEGNERKKSKMKGEYQSKWKKN